MAAPLGVPYSVALDLVQVQPALIAGPRRRQRRPGEPRTVGVLGTV